MKMLQGINVWNRSCELAVNTYTTLSTCNDPVFREQTTRSCLAVASRIAEGYDFESSDEFCEYLKIARGTCAVLRTQLYLAGVMGIIDNDRSTDLIEEALELSRMLEGLISCFQRAVDHGT
jgi:four helix bundle protein